MGDPSTHVIFFSAYWHLVFIEYGRWVGTQDFAAVCKVGEEETAIELIAPEAP